jgi:hypothetical protein
LGQDIKEGEDRAEYVLGTIGAVVVLAVALLGDSLLGPLGTLVGRVGTWLGGGAV